MNCLWFYATKIPLGTIRKSSGLSPIWVCRRYNIHRRRYTSVVVDIHRLYVTKGDVKHNQLDPSEVFTHLWGGGGFLIQICTLSPNIACPLREPLPLTSLTYMCKNTPFLIILCAHTIRGQSLNWADHSSSKLFETKSPMCKLLETKFPIERALASR